MSYLITAVRNITKKNPYNLLSNFKGELFSMQIVTDREYIFLNQSAQFYKHGKNYGFHAFMHTNTQFNSSFNHIQLKIIKKL